MGKKSKFIHVLAAGALLTTAVAMPVQQAAAANGEGLGGALLGGAAGAVIGGAVTGRAGGAIIGGALGAVAGSAIARNGERRRGGYYYYNRGCYSQGRDGRWYHANRRYC